MDQMESYRKKLKVIERIERVKHNSNGASRVLMKCMTCFCCYCCGCCDRISFFMAQCRCLVLQANRWSHILFGSVWGGSNVVEIRKVYIESLVLSATMPGFRQIRRLLFKCIFTLPFYVAPRYKASISSGWRWD